jgi:prevent-host-death family protein
LGYAWSVSREISQRELRNDNADVVRRVLAGESFVVTRNGRPVADLVPHQAEADRPRPTLGEVQAIFRALPPVDAREWLADIRRDDGFEPDDPLVDPWDRGGPQA